jgi:multiple sugar transport system permease protein
VVVAASSLSAFAFARLRFPGRELLFVLFLGTLIVPQEVLIVPMYWLMQVLGWVDSYQALILPFAFTAFGTFLLRQFFLTVPAELVDSARVDGAGLFNIFFRIMLPLSRPALAVLAMFTFIGYWGSLLWPLIVIDNVNAKGTVPLGLNQFIAQQGTQYHLMMAAAMLAMVPSVLLVVLLQKNLTRGLLTTGFGGR